MQLQTADMITALDVSITKLRALAKPDSPKLTRDKAEQVQNELLFDIAQASLVLLGGALIDLNRIASALERKND